MAWMGYLRGARQAAATYATVRNVYNSLPNADTFSNYLPGWGETKYSWGTDGSVPLASDQAAADRAYVQRAMGYRLNPNTVPAIGVGSRRSSRSSVRRSRINVRAAASQFSNRMRRRGAGGRRRYSGKRRGYRRVRGYKRRKMPFSKKVKRQAVRAGFRSNKQYGSICRDLGTMFPECLSVKLYLHFQHPIQRAAGTAETFAAYDQYIVCYPYHALVNWNSNAASTAVSGYTNIATVSPMGWTRLIGTSGASAMYQECLVVSMAHDLRLDFQVANTWNLTDAATDKIVAPTRHFYHMFDTGGTAQTAPTTQALSDTYAQQPDVKMKVTSGQNQGNAGSADTTNNATMVVSNGRSVRWRGSIWPHKVQEIPLDTYIGDKANWGNSTTLPENHATLQFSGAMAGLTASDTTTYGPVLRGLCTGSLCFTVLLKTPLAAVS